MNVHSSTSTRGSRPLLRRPAMLIAVVSLFAATAVSCSSDTDDAGRPERRAATTTNAPEKPSDTAYPGDDWATISPEDAGFDPTKLDAIAADAEPNSNCLLVTRHGRLVKEWYWNDTDEDTAQEVWSVTKSVSSTLVGIAEERGDLSLEDSVSTYVSEWKGTPAEEVDVLNLVNNTSGREWTFTKDFLDLTGAADRTAFGIEESQDVAPGTRWAYSNAAIQILNQVLTEATGEKPKTYAEEVLFEPIGMTNTDMTTDESGGTLMYMGLQSTCTDLARFGYLFLRDGKWQDQQIVPADWVDDATKPSQDIYTSYGYLWWLNSASPLGSPQAFIEEKPTGPADKPGISADLSPSAYYASGMFGQTILVDPETDTVAVRLGPSGGNLLGDFNEKDLAKVVTEALVEPTK